MRWTLRLRQVVNWVNLSTAMALLLAATVGRARITRGPEGLFIADHYRLWTRQPVITVGNVVLMRIDRELLDRHPRLLRHEARHATQFAWCLGAFGMAVLYPLACLWSWVWSGDVASYNVFERLAGLEDGGYPPPRRRRRLA